MAKIGRPTRYKPEYCKAIVKYFQDASKKELRKEIIKEEFYQDGKVKNKHYQIIADNLPFFSEFEQSIKVHIGSCSVWKQKEKSEDKEIAKIFKGFSKAYNSAKEIQKRILIKNGLAGLTNPAFTIFTAKNITDMRDQTEVKHDVSDKLSSLLTEISDNRQDLAKPQKNKA